MARHRAEKKREPADCRVLVVELLQDGGSKLVAVDRFRQIVLKPWRAHTGISHAERDESDGRYVARWIWCCLLREDQEQQGKHYKTSDDEGQ
jgi:hypothetical protein